MITCCNLIMGCCAIDACFHCPMPVNYLWAVIFIIMGAVFDFFDGMTARLLGVSSPIGKELDSLADVVTFGVAPSCIIFCLFREVQYPALLEPVRNLMPYTAFLVAAFSALRLAKFNLDTRQTTSFIGVPTPANALFWGSLAVGQHAFLVYGNFNAVWLFLFMIAACGLLVAELPLFALKFKNLSWEDNKIKYVFLLGCVPCFFLGLSCFAAIILWYVFLSMANNYAGSHNN